jgi:hypothetical protein
MAFTDKTETRLNKDETRPTDKAETRLRHGRDKAETRLTQG